jgi:hypothetical protein
MKYSAAWVNDFPPGAILWSRGLYWFAGETAGEVGTREGEPFGGRETLWRRKAHERRRLKHGGWADDGKTRGRVEETLGRDRNRGEAIPMDERDGVC